MKRSWLQDMRKINERLKSLVSTETGEPTQVSVGLSKLNVFRSRYGGGYVATPIPIFWNCLVPRYHSKVVGPLVVNLSWDRSYAVKIREISEKRFVNRCTGYLDPKEVQRVKAKLKSKGEASIRFGFEKHGHGYSGERGDFCLVGGVVRGKNLSLFYRSLELIGGFAYDLTLIRQLESLLEKDFQTVTIFATKAFTFALKGNSNEKLFPKLQEIFRG